MPNLFDGQYQNLVPNHRGFENWQDWAKAVAGIMSIIPNLETMY